MTNRYSLADYIVTIKLPGADSLPIDYQNLANKEIKIGGPGESAGGIGSFLGQISISRSNDQWSTESDNTGSWVHNQNLSKVGTVELNIRQVSDNVIRLIQLCNIYNSTRVKGGLTITVTPAANDATTTYAECVDYYPVKIPDQDFGATAAEQSWSFTCGMVNFPVTTNWDNI